MQNLQNLRSVSSSVGGQGNNPAQKLFQYITSLPGLVAYYPLNETSGSDSLNKAPDNIGSLDAGITGATIGQSGQVGLGYVFDGVNDLLTIDNDALLNFTTPAMTILALINPASGGDSSQEIVKKDSQYILRLGNNNKQPELILWADTDASQLLADDALVEGTAYLIAAVYDDSADNSKKIYVNGTVVKSSNNQAGNLDSGSNNVTVGNQAGTGEGFSGLIQHVAIFNTALSQGVISNITSLAGLA